MTQVYPVRGRHGVGKPGAIGGGTFRRVQVCQVAPKTEASVCERFPVCGYTFDLRNKPGSRRTLGSTQLTLGKIGVPFRVTDTDPCGFSPNGSSPFLFPIAKSGSPSSPCLFYGPGQSRGCSHIRTSHIRLGSFYLGRVWCLHRSKWVMC
jgi:hypothetical protein